MSKINEDFSIDSTPLAERMRARSLDEFVGQEHIVGKDNLIRRALSVNRLGSCIFFGPPGIGKTTLAYIIANSLGLEYEKLNAVSSGVADAKRVIETAKRNFELTGKSTILILDECHRWSKSQSDSVLEAVERGYITFIGTTTENPYRSMTPAIVSRCRVFKFLPLTRDDIKDALIRAIKDNERGYGRLKVKLDVDALNHFAMFSSGDLRSAYNALELAVTTTKPDKTGTIKIDKLVASQCIQQPIISVDDNTYYDLLSAFCKSLRGSDATAALYYANRLIESGVEPQLLARRTICHASEDCCSAKALNTACNALYVLDNLGMPEGNLALSQAIIEVCEAPKTNRVVVAMNMAQDDAKNHPDDNIPPYLKNHTEDSKNYKYPHDYGGYVEQQYLPDSLKTRNYFPKK